MKPAASETNAPRCPYCGHKMTLASSFDKKSGWSCFYLCCECYSQSPSTFAFEYSMNLTDFEHHKVAAYQLAVQRSEISAMEFLYQRERMKRELGFPFAPRDISKIEAIVEVVKKWAADNPERSVEG